METTFEEFEDMQGCVGKYGRIWRNMLNIWKHVLKIIKTYVRGVKLQTREN